MHDGLADLCADVLVDFSEAEARQIDIPPFSADTYMQDLLRVTEGLAQPELVDLLIGRSRETMVWMRGKGVRFIPMLGRQSLYVSPGFVVHATKLHRTRWPPGPVRGSWRPRSPRSRPRATR